MSELFFKICMIAITAIALTYLLVITGQFGVDALTEAIKYNDVHYTEGVGNGTNR